MLASSAGGSPKERERFSVFLLPMASSEREQLLGDSSTRRPTHPESGPDYGTTTASKAALTAQQEAFREQDSELELLAGGVKGIRNIAGWVNSEVESQNQLLDKVLQHAERADDKTRAAVVRTSAIEQSPYSISNFCMLLWPLVLLILMLFFGLKHLLFG